MKLGETIKTFRIANDYSTKQVAEFCGVSSTHISEIENNNKTPSLEMFWKIAKCFNVPASFIMKIHEDSEEGKWNYQKTLVEILKIYVGK